MKLSLRQKMRLEWGIVALGVLVAVVGGELAESKLCGVTGTLTILAAIFVGELVWNRCPSCGSILWRVSPFRHEFCPHCGEKIDWDAKQS